MLRCLISNDLNWFLLFLCRESEWVRDFRGLLILPFVLVLFCMDFWDHSQLPALYLLSYPEGEGVKLE